jgi:hypothetical protein
MTDGCRGRGVAARMLFGSGLLIAGATGAQGLPHEEPATALKPLQAQNIAVGALPGGGYFIREADGFYVAAMLADGGHWPLRVGATRPPGQTRMLATSGALDVPPDEMRVAREGDALIRGDDPHRID